LWGPLLIHARLAGPESEAKLLAVVDKFSQEKAEIKSADSQIAQTIALLDAISKHADTTFTPGDLVPILAQSEAWGRTMAEAKGRDDNSVHVARSAKVGNFLRKFRLRGKKNGDGHIAYDSESAIACLSAHVPQNPPQPPQPPSQNPQEVQLTGNSVPPEGTESTETFGSQTPKAIDENYEPSGRQGLDLWNSVRAAVAQLPSVSDRCTSDAMMEGEI
jgi:hypothetical protein